jgi:thiol-disulfide isomerase/thioredoxin
MVIYRMGHEIKLYGIYIKMVSSSVPKFTQLISKYFQPYQTRILWIVLILLFLGVGIYTLWNSIQFQLHTKNTKQDLTNISNANRRNDSLQILLFMVDWCPHCKHAKPEWISYVQTYDGTLINNYMIECIGGKDGINCTNTNDPNVQDAIQRYNVEHYPTLKLKKDGIVYDYNGPITKSTIESFVSSISSG